MSDFPLSDCIRSTPGRTVGALLVAGYQRLGRVSRRRVTTGTSSENSAQATRRSLSNANRKAAEVNHSLEG